MVGAIDQKKKAEQATFGAVEGRIETLSCRPCLSFALYDSLDDRAISCMIRPDQVAAARDGWGKRVVIEGWIRREPATGRPITIDPVESINVLPEIVPGAYRRARAVAPAQASEPSPEAAIRRLRDA